MRESGERERTIGIARYVTSADGIGGRLRVEPSDFRVRELETIEPARIDADPGSYPHLLMRVRLREWDTNDFARELSRRLGASRERVAWAGTKDKHAHTTQLFSVRDAEPTEIPQIADAAIDVLGRLGRPLSFGDLAGNAFRIRVRETDGSPAPITADLRRWWRTDGDRAGDGTDPLDEPTTPAGATIVTDASRDAPGGWGDDVRPDGDSTTPTTDDGSTTPTADGDSTTPTTDGDSTTPTADDGSATPTADDGSATPTTDGDSDDDRPDSATTRVAVPNWYGHQRFGSRRPITHEVGFRIVAGDPRGAVVTYAGNPFETEPDASREGRRVVDREAASDDPDWATARDALPSHLRFERAMLTRLVEWEASDDGHDSATSDDSRDPTADDGVGGHGTEMADDEVGGHGTGMADDEVGGHGAERGEEHARWWHALAAVPENLRRLFVNAAQSALFNRIVSERLERGLPFDRPVAGDVVCFRADADRVARPDPDRTTRATSERLDVLQRHCERGRAFVTAPVIGYETQLADGEPGEIERAVLREASLEPADFDVRDPYGASGTRRALLVGCDLSVDRADGDPVFRFALPSGAYATALLREYLQTPPDRL